LYGVTYRLPLFQNVPNLDEDRGGGIEAIGLLIGNHDSSGSQSSDIEHPFPVATRTLNTGPGV
jgi:hypothetical protein